MIGRQPSENAQIMTKRSQEMTNFDKNEHFQNCENDHFFENFPIFEDGS